MKDPKSVLNKVNRLLKDAESIKQFLIALVEQEEQARALKDADTVTCLYCKQQVASDSLIRGVCKSSCYYEARRRVTEGKTTWEALEKANLILPVGATKIGRPKSSKLSKTEIERLEKLASKSSSRKSS